MFHTKICGVRSLADIKAVSSSGSDAVGFNFFPRSVRFVDPKAESTRVLADAAQAAGLFRVGLFVNESVAQMVGVVERIGIDIIQLHGDEDVNLVRELRRCIDRPLIRAIKLPIGPLTVELIESNVSPWLEIGCLPLLDAEAGRSHGGSGKQLDWLTIGRWSEGLSDVEWILAGGLTPENVGRAIKQSGAQRVDVASGVEEERGKKSATLIRRFAENR